MAVELFGFAHSFSFGSPHRLGPQFVTNSRICSSRRRPVLGRRLALVVGVAARELRAGHDKAASCVALLKAPVHIMAIVSSRTSYRGGAFGPFRGPMQFYHFTPLVECMFPSN